MENKIVDEENSTKSIIQKIKNQELDKEAKLIEKRKLEATLASLDRNIRETKSCASKLKDECTEVTTKAAALQAKLVTEKIRLQALESQLESSTKELKLLKMEAEKRITEVWGLRNTLCQEVQNVSDQCDVWALFTKPKYLETPALPKKVRVENTDKANDKPSEYEETLKRRQELISERDRLINEPHSGEHFVRIRNALNYSVQMTNQMKQ